MSIRRCSILPWQRGSSTTPRCRTRLSMDMILSSQPRGHVIIHQARASDKNFMRLPWLTEFLDLAVHLLDLAFQELLLELDDFFRVLGPNELLREVEGGVDVHLGEVDRLAVDRPPPGLGRLDGRLHGAVQAVCLAHVLVDGLPGLGQRAFRRLSDALRQIGLPAAAGWSGRLVGLLGHRCSPGLPDPGGRRFNELPRSAFSCRGSVTALVTALRIPPPLRSLARDRYQLQPARPLYSGTPVSVGIIEQSA